MSANVNTSVSASASASPALRSPDLPAGTVAMLAAPELDSGLVSSLTREFERRGTVSSVEQRQVPIRPQSPSQPLSSVEVARWSVTLDDSDDTFGTQLVSSLLDDASAQLTDSSQEVTATVLPAQSRPEGPLMLLMDVDSTLIDQEVIELLARHAGREEEVAEVTERAMRGELDFEASLHARVATLKDLPLSVIDSTVRAVTPTQGAKELLSSFLERGWPAYAVSGGFLQILAPLAADLGLTGFDANDLGSTENSLTGAVHGAVVDRAAKARRLHEWSAEHALTPEQVVAIGDGANDLDMVRAAGVGVAFCPKPALAEESDLVIRHRSLELVGLALGLR